MGGLTASELAASEPVDDFNDEGNVASKIVVLVVDTDDPVCGSPCVSAKHAVLVPEHVDAEDDDDEDDVDLLVGYDDDVVHKDEDRLAEIRFPTTSKCSDEKSQQFDISSGESLVPGLSVATPLFRKKNKEMLILKSC